VDAIPAVAPIAMKTISCATCFFWQCWRYQAPVKVFAQKSLGIHVVGLMQALIFGQLRRKFHPGNMQRFTLNRSLYSLFLQLSSIIKKV
jgi:hypothetical protein